MDIWAFLTDEQNREVLAWLGGGLVVVAGGLWTAITFFAARKVPDKKSAAPTARVTSRDGIAAGGDVTVDTRHGLTGWQPVLLVLVVAGAVLLAAAFAGSRVTATNGSIAVGGDVGGAISTGATGEPAPPSQ